MHDIRGVVPVVPIPFLPDESIDEESFDRVVEFVVSRKLAALCLPAYGSEFYKLTEGEREWAVGAAITASAERVPVIAQANHGSSRVAAQLARRYEKLGANVIGVALPRQFAVGAAELTRHVGQIADAVSLPILVQDFNPGGPTIDDQFIHTLHKQHSNVRYVKLEEPLVVDKLTAIRQRMGESVEVFQGWGGYYLLEALSTGNCAAVMPGVAVADLFNRIYQASHRHDHRTAFDLFGAMLPYVNLTLQNLELFLQVEKQLLVRRGLLTQAICRSPKLTPSAANQQYIDSLLDWMLLLLGGEDMASNPVAQSHLASGISR
ncbi:MAG: dihydrodipicolinate synthase family protein [Pirellulales bacterium]|nr:dihydrodipicolinate synthase family protein [Pirellulales bacterium]